MGSWVNSCKKFCQTILIFEEQSVAQVRAAQIYCEELHCIVVEGGGYSKLIKLAGGALLQLPRVALEIKVK